MDFSVAVPLLERTLSAFSDIRSLNLRKIPKSIQTEIGTKAGQVREWLDNVKGFSLAEPGLEDRRNDLLDQLESHYYEILSTLAPLVGYLLLKQPGLAEEVETATHEKLQDLDQRASDLTAQHQRIIEEVRSENAMMRSEKERIIEEVRSEKERIIGDASSVLESIQGIAAKAGVGQQSTVFWNQVKNDRSTSKKWLVAACATGGLSLAVVCAVVLWPLSAETTSEAVRAFGGRLAILTFFAFALGFTVRQYTSSKHNEMVNLHRTNALRTFTTFVGAASDQEMKDAVLLEATRAIFAPQPSGFLRAGHETESPSTIIEVIRRISSGTANKP